MLATLRTTTDGRSQEHPLVDEQVNGITLHRVAEINRRLLG